jgi:hypothetical protein
LEKEACVFQELGPITMDTGHSVRRNWVGSSPQNERMEDQMEQHEEITGNPVYLS